MNETSPQIVIQSNGLGVESHAILERWVAEPASRPFADWSQLVVVTAQVGEEQADTIRNAESRMLPLLREHNIRFVELARRGHLEEDGIIVLQDSRSPMKLHPQGAYKLSDELLKTGTVPQFGGEHKCAMKFKAFVIETWLAYEFRNCSDRPVYHVFGYNADEKSRISNSDVHIARHNEDRNVAVTRTPIEVFGFNSDEVGRIERSKKYDGPNRIGNYPLQEWGWNRQQCIDYILLQSGINWVKSACAFCPFCGEAARGEDAVVSRWLASPDQTAHGLLVEYNALCFNPRGQLYSRTAMVDVITKRQITSVLAAFHSRLASMQWGFYRVRRIYTAKGKAFRSVERLGQGSRQQMSDRFDAMSESMTVESKREISYAYFQRRVEDVYPTAEGFYVIAPLFMDSKVRGSLAKFNERWARVVAGLSVNEEASAEETLVVA